jgi:biopolymer transport protein ExbD
VKLRREEPESPEINITPLIDVVFLLLIFFMVSTTFQRFSELQVDLPEASAEEEARSEEIIDLTIDAAGRYYVNGRQLVSARAEALRRALAELRGTGRAPPLVINADARTPHQAVITAMDVARQVGLMRLSFATEQLAEEGAGE